MADSVITTEPLGFPWKTEDPFLFCVHHEDAYPKGNDDMGPAVSLDGHTLGNDFTKVDGFRMYHGHKVPGFPAHPHRGFETVTIAKKGLVDHSDSLGAAGRFGEGDTQWMTAGKGVQHSEMFPLLNREGENPFEIFQIWLNLPAKSKMVEPYFGMLWKDQIPKETFIDDKGNKTTITIISGPLANHEPPTPPPDSWASDSANEVAIWTIEMEPGANWIIPPASEGINRNLYLYDGEQVMIDSQTLKNYHRAKLNAESAVKVENGNHNSRLLLLQGKPIGEPVVQHGPFVMNSEEEIMQAFQEYRATQFGGWPWPTHDHVHDREKPRFAIHADGRMETKSE